MMMKPRSLAFLFLCLFHFVSALWPIPRSLQTGTTFLQLSPKFDIQVIDIPDVPSDLLDAISRTKSHLSTDQLQRLIVGRGANDSAVLNTAPSLVKLTLALNANSPTIKSIMEEATKEIGTRNEGYSLTVPAKNQGVATLTADSSLGLLRGLTTFEQLWYQVSGKIYSYQAPVQISNDSPAYVSISVMLYSMTIYSCCFRFSRIEGSCWIQQEICRFPLCINPISDILLISCLQLCSR